LHDGTIEAHSDGLDQGSEFVVRLPIIAPPLEPTLKKGDPKPTALKGNRILIVDDSKDAADTLAMLLRLRGNEIRTAYDGLEAVKVAESYRPQLILLDIGLPKMNGYDVALEVRRQTWGRDVILVALTGWGQAEDRRRSKEAGFDFHIVKPVEIAALEKLLAEPADKVR
jgi:CheY-like chemotaxis protein